MAKADVVKRIVAYIIDGVLGGALMMACVVVGLVIFMVSAMGGPCSNNPDRLQLF
jgi:hypothetical protein